MERNEARKQDERNGGYASEQAPLVGGPVMPYPACLPQQPMAPVPYHNGATPMQMPMPMTVTPGQAYPQQMPMGMPMQMQQPMAMGYGAMATAFVDDPEARAKRQAEGKVMVRVFGEVAFGFVTIEKDKKPTAQWDHIAEGKSHTAVSYREDRRLAHLGHLFHEIVLTLSGEPVEVSANADVRELKMVIWREFSLQSLGYFHDPSHFGGKVMEEQDGWFGNKYEEMVEPNQFHLYRGQQLQISGEGFGYELRDNHFLSHAQLYDGADVVISEHGDGPEDTGRGGGKVDEGCCCCSCCSAKCMAWGVAVWLLLVVIFSIGVYIVEQYERKRLAAYYARTGANYS